MTTLKSDNTAKHIWRPAEWRQKHFVAALIVIAALMVAAFLVTGYLFGDAYGDLRDSIQQERMAYIAEISRQMIAAKQFMEKEYASTAEGLAKRLSRGDITTLEQARNELYLINNGIILLAGEGGEVTNIEGHSVSMMSTDAKLRLREGIGPRQVFASLNMSVDCLMFAHPTVPVTVDGIEYDTVVLAVPEEEYRSGLSTELFDGRASAYIISMDGSVVISPAASRRAFSGYNLLASIETAGADSEEVGRIRQSLQDEYSSHLVHIDGEDWLISHAVMNQQNAIIVTVPVQITGASTYAGLDHVVIRGMLTVLMLAGFAFTVITMLILRDRRHTREAMAMATKNAFFSKLNHDIRTPLNTILGLELLARDATDDPVTKEYLAQSSSAAKYLLGLINDVLDMSRIESGKLTLGNEPIAIAEMLADVRNVIQPQVADKRQEFTVESEQGLADVYMGDPMRVKQILINLLSNAVKFTPEGGHVRLAAAPDPMGRGDGIIVTVQDDGIGISSDYIPRLYKPFEQARSSYTGGYTGSGLGLSIVHSLVTLMNGSIDMETRDGAGTTFTVSLPLARGEGDGRTVRADSGEPAKFTGRRILLVEDNTINRKVAATLLSKKFEFETDCAENGREALEMFRESALHYYDAVLMDVKMPVMDGLEATRRIRSLKREDAATVPIIALSANAFVEDVAISLASGMNDHLSKPIDIAALNAAFEKYLLNKEELI